jgi:hypothetical protein
VITDNLVSTLNESTRRILNETNESIDALKTALNISQFTSQNVCAQSLKVIAMKFESLLEHKRENFINLTLFQELVTEIARLKNISRHGSKIVLAEFHKKLQRALYGYLEAIKTMSGQIAVLAIAEKFKEAEALLRKADENLQPELMRKTVTLLYVKKDLRKAIKMAAYGYTYINKYAGYQSVFEQMKGKGELNKLEILLLQWYIVRDIEYVNFESQPDKVKEDYRKLRSEVDVPVENVIVSLAEDIGKSSYERTIDVGKRLGYKVLNMFIPRLIRKFYSPGTLSQAAVLVEYVEKLQYSSNECIAGEEIYNQMKQRNQLESFEAFMHWMQIRLTIYYQPSYIYMAEENKAKCQRVYDEQKANAEKHIDRFLQLYDSGSYEADVTSRNNEYGYTFHWIVEDVVRKRFKGNLSNVDKLIKFFKAFNWRTVDCLGSAFLASEMRNHNQLGTSEALRVYEVMHKSIIKSPNYLTSIEFRICLEEKEKAPRWILSRLT